MFTWSKRSTPHPKKSIDSTATKEDLTQDSQGEDPFQLLPDEVIVEILSYLSINDLAHRVSLINRRFREVSLNAKLWTVIEIPNWVDRQTTVRLLDRCFLLNKLVMKLRTDDENCKKDSQFLSSYALMRCLKLKTLEMNSFSATAEDFLNTISKHGKSLRRLVVRAGTPWCGSVLTANPRSISKLTHIELYDLDGDGLRAIADNCKNLQHFQHDQEELWTDNEMNHFLENVNTSIKCLVIFGMRLTDSSFKSLEKCHLLQRIEIRNAKNLGWQGLDSIFKLPDLNSLLIGHGFKLRDHDFMDALYGKCLNKLSSLTTLGCDFGDQGVEAIVKACPNLVRLKLGFETCIVRHVMTDKFLRVIADNCPRLEHFCIDKCFPEFTNKTINYFLGRVQPSIKSFSMGHLSGISSLRNLGKCKQMESISLLYPLKLKASDLRYILKLPSLTSLSIFYLHEFGRRDFIEAFRHRKTLHNLTSLELSSCCKLDDRSLKAIANSCPELKHLGLNGLNNVTEVGIRHVLIQCLKLKSLEVVSNNSIPVETFRNVNAPLNVLKISATDADIAYKNGLRSVMPRVDVYFRSNYAWM